ncbi:hypothetical protein, partial [Klebsiella pneumoniae]|uniref:hypothetical protein n=1 Tax=Klebsiella pneumoniae TaxID=573 RepID=UPI001953B620
FYVFFNYLRLGREKDFGFKAFFGMPILLHCGLTRSKKNIKLSLDIGWGDRFPRLGSGDYGYLP